LQMRRQSIVFIKLQLNNKNICHIQLKPFNEMQQMIQIWKRFAFEPLPNSLSAYFEDVRGRQIQIPCELLIGWHRFVMATAAPP